MTLWVQPRISFAPGGCEMGTSWSQLGFRDTVGLEFNVALIQIQRIFVYISVHVFMHANCQSKIWIGIKNTSCPQSNAKIFNPIWYIQNST